MEIMLKAPRIMLKAPRIMLEPLRIIAKAPGMAKAPRIMAKYKCVYKWRKHHVVVEEVVELYLFTLTPSTVADFHV